MTAYDLMRLASPSDDEPAPCYFCDEEHFTCAEDAELEAADLALMRIKEDER